MNEAAKQWIQQLPTSQWTTAVNRLLTNLLAEVNEQRPFSNSRSRAIVIGGGFLDEGTWAQFKRLMETDSGPRVAAYDLITTTDLDTQPPTDTAEMKKQTAVDWLPLILAAHAYKTDYPLSQLDPDSLPGAHTPAGLMLLQAAHFVRRQVQRTATERDRIAGRLAYTGPPSVPTAEPQETAAPGRPTIPVRYPEYNPEIRLEANEVDRPSRLQTEPTIVITEDDLPQEPAAVDPQTSSTPPPPSSQQRPQQIQLHRPRPQPNTSGFMAGVRKMFRGEELKTTRLRITAHETPNGSALPGLQVRVSCRGLRSYVAGTTNQNGTFVCELPVRLRQGVTYAVEITWPREMGHEAEQKSITINADRTEYQLPFYRRHIL